MALSIIGTPAAVAATSITLPTHAVGDIIVIFAYRDGSTTVPTKPTASGTVPAWVDIDAPTGANTNSARCAYFVATATNHTSGTWTNATGMSAIVIRGQRSSPIGGHAQSGSTGTNTASAPSITQQQTTGKSMILHFYGHRAVTAWSAAPAGYTRRASVSTEVCLNTKDSSTSDGAIAQPATASSSGYRGQTVEILAPETSPTVALSSPADASSGSDTTPDLTFTGTDSEADDVRYEVQVDTVNTFDSSLGTEAVDQQQNSTGASFGFGENAIVRYRGQVFTNGVAGKLTKIGFSRNVGSYGIKVYIDTVDGSNLPAHAVGSELYSFTIPNASLVSGYGEYALPVGLTLTAGTKYVMYLAPWDTVGNAYHDDYQDAQGIASISGGVTEVTNNNGTWSTENLTFRYKTYITPAGPLLDEISGTDAGFSGSPDNSDPFTSGQAITHTIQSALAGGTYYWRVRAKDPSGSNAYGAWATTRSFTVNVAATYSITKSLKYTIIKAVTAITKSLKYTVRTTPSTITKSLHYFVAKAGTITKSAKYAVLKAITVTKSLKYTVKRTPSTVTKSLKYAALKSLTKTKSLVYKVKASIPAITKALKYAIATAHTVTKSIKYAVRTSPSTITKALRYKVLKAITITKSLTYDVTVTSTSTVTKAVRYLILKTRTITKSLVYRVRTSPATLTKSLRYFVLKSRTITKSLKYGVKNPSTITKQLAYRVAHAITLTKVLRYSVSAGHQITKSLRYLLVTSTSLTKALRYYVQNTGTVNKVITYRVVTSHALTKSMRYVVQARRRPLASLNRENVASIGSPTVQPGLDMYNIPPRN